VATRGFVDAAHHFPPTVQMAAFRCKQIFLPNCVRTGVRLNIDIHHRNIEFQVKIDTCHSDVSVHACTSCSSRLIQTNRRGVVTQLLDYYYYYIIIKNEFDEGGTVTLLLQDHLTMLPYRVKQQKMIVKTGR